MRVATGKVIGGKVVVEGAALVEGASVTVLVRESDETFEVTPAQEVELLRALSEAERDDVITADQLLKDLRRRTT
jgi:hypothetical protein